MAQRMEETSEQRVQDDFCEKTGTFLGTIQRIIYPIIFLFILLVGLALNLAVMWILVARIKRWNRSTIFLFNLVLADITWILCLPCLIYYHFNYLHWIFGDAACKITRTIYHTCYYCSIYFVTCLSIDRYLAIVHPLKSLRILKKHQSLLISLTIWMATSISSLPVTFLAGTQVCENNKTICSLYVFSEETHVTLPYSLISTAVGCLLPFASICYCYCSSVGELRRVEMQRLKKRNLLSKLMCSALVIFGLLYLPYHASRNSCILLRVLTPTMQLAIERADALFFIEMAVCSLNTCINPLFCFLAGGDFREQVCRIVNSFPPFKKWKFRNRRTVCPI
ncbi:PREDICTED: P2Y purinoceptor 1-like [Nanorana parkeri]|uniref:P2Y purinoceptor 1-like n=1 Tax=Nanorana parkeri TaxID=125878 RepID=UPI00085503E1|nr:PREDICTED: P2Y purinoceptor 1-like [Nanorana parkeri]